MQKKIKISQRFRKNRFSSTVSPKLILVGDWLKKAGFQMGEVVKVIVADSHIQIFKINERGEYGN
jgi:hypothetical protein